MPIKWKNISVPDAINLVVGACLFASPWIFDFWSDPALPDERRDRWLQHPLLTTIELWVTLSGARSWQCAGRGRAL